MEKAKSAYGSYLILKESFWKFYSYVSLTTGLEMQSFSQHIPTQDAITVLFPVRMETGWEASSFCHKCIKRRLTKIAKGLEMMCEKNLKKLGSLSQVREDDW